MKKALIVIGVMLAGPIVALMIDIIFITGTNLKCNNIELLIWILFIQSNYFLLFGFIMAKMIAWSLKR